MLELLFSSTARVKVLALLLLNPETSFYQREISALTGLPIRAIQREVERLQALGLLTSFTRGNQVHYQVNRDFFLFPELKSIFLKTVGLTALLGNALKEAENITLAFMYGSYAADQESTASDIDLLVVGTISSRTLHTTLQEAEKLTHREINYTLFSPEEFRTRAQTGNGFLRNVLTAPKLFLIGDEDALRALVA
ncbi:MAG: nucleotidyltransferase domain-containing protein [Anaerolineae bacterium]